MQPPTVVMWNTQAGSSAGASAARELLNKHPECLLIEADSAAAAQEQVRSAIHAGSRRVVAAGGDGSVNLALQAIADTGKPDIELAVLPLGTGNDLARTLGMSLSIDADVDIVLNAAASLADLMRCTWNGGQRVIANMCTAGNTGLYLQRLDADMKQRWGPYCYLRGVIDVLKDLQVFEARFEWPDQPAENIRFLNLFAAQGRTTGAGVTVAPHAELDDGLIDVIIVKDGDAVDLASLTANFVLANFLEHPLVVYRQVRKLSVTATGPLPITIDGDVATEGPFTIDFAPQRIQLVRPAAAT